MNNFKELIDEAVLRTPMLKSKIKSMQADFEKAFGDKLYSRKFDYNVNIDDLNALFMLLNHWLFKDKLDINKITITISTNIELHKEKGVFKIGIDNKKKHVLGIVKYTKDNFFHIVNVFIHEMIHYYDLVYGPLKNVITIVNVSNVNGKQYIGEYDAHGLFFKSECKRINMLGFDVKEKYSLKDKVGMKKILEKNRSTDAFFDKKTIKDDEQYKCVKQMYDALTNCNKDMVYRDAKHWYIQIDG